MFEIYIYICVCVLEERILGTARVDDDSHPRVAVTERMDGGRGIEGDRNVLIDELLLCVTAIMDTVTGSC